LHARLRDVSPFYLAMIHAGLDDQEQGSNGARARCNDRYNWMVWLGVEPIFEKLRGAAPFAAMLRRIGL